MAVMARRGIEYYAKKGVDKVLCELCSCPSGITDREAQKRLAELGPNTLVQKKETPLVVQFLSHFLNPMILILLIASIVSYFVHEPTDAIIIGVMVLVGVVLDFYQEYSAGKALKKLLESVKTEVTVIRNGKRYEINAVDVAVGDVLALSSGDLISADARIIDCRDFFVNQSALTGESFPVEKFAHYDRDIKGGISALDNVIFSGTSVVSGSAEAVVLKTGQDTEFGKISAKLAETEQISEFERGINNFGMFIMKIILVMVIFIFFFNSFVKHDYFQSFMFAIAIAVGLTPELLPMIMSITMTAGSKKMAAKGVIVKKLSSIPSFGSMNILCTDKTGTLTVNKIKVVKYSDYLGNEDKRVLMLAHLNSLYQTGIKNPMDEAVLAVKKIRDGGYSKVDEVPYDFFRKRMSVIVRRHREDIIITKGAPEEMFGICKYCSANSKREVFTKAMEKKAEETYHYLSSQGYRVLAVAEKRIAQKDVYSKKDESDMEFIGFISFLDPPKKDVKKVLREFEKLGIEIKVITGDNEFVSKKICQEVGLEVKGILTGNDVDTLEDNDLYIKASETTLFTRFSPTQKSRLIQVLKSKGNVVGYMGDGVNDAPSLKTADVGISVDTAVDITKESADMVLTRKSLHDLKEGVVEGRKTFANTMKYIMMGISSNFGNMFSAAVAIMMVPFLPMLPIQILLNNLIYDFSQITIPTDNVDKGWVEKPRRWNIKFIKRFMYVFGPISSFYDILTFVVLFFVLKVSAGGFQTGWFMESLATQTLIIHIIRTKDIPFVKSVASLPLIISSIACVVIGWILPYTHIGRYFKFTPLPLHVILILGGIVLAYLITVTVVKTFFYKKWDF